MATAEQTRTAEEVARSYFAAIGARDADAAAAHWDPDGVDDVVPVGVFRGVEEIRGWLASTLAAIPDMEMSVQRVIGGERSAVVEWRMSGHFTGAPFQGVAPNGRHVEMRGADWFEIVEGKIISNSAYYDGASFARSVGLLPPQDSSAEKAMLVAFNGATKLRAAVRERLDR